MQFFPASEMQSTSASSSASLSSSKENSEGGNGFEAIVERLTAAANASDSQEKTASASYQTSQRNAQKASMDAAGAARKNTAESNEKGTVVDFKTKIVTKEDFAALKDALADYGFSKAEINAIEDRVNAGGLNWGSFLKTLSDKAGPEAALALRPGLSSQMRTDIQSFLQKIGIMPDQASKLLNDLENGDVESVWNAISGAIQNMPKAGANALDSTELQAISTALGLSPKAQEKLTAIVNGKRNGTMSKEQLAAAIKVIDKDAAEMQALLDDNATSELRDRLAKILGDASERGDVLTRASKRTGKEVEQARERIARSAKEGTDGMSGMGDEDGGGEDLATVAQKAARTAGEALDGNELTYMDKLRARQMGTDGDGASGKGTGTEVGSGKTDKDADDDDLFSKFGDNDKDDKTWAKMFDRISDQTKPTTHVDTTKLHAEELELAAAQSLESAKQSASKAAMILKQANVSPEQVLEQVQNGLLKSLQGGGKELTLRLDPPDLGQLTLILQVNNKEVNATIRTESHEMTKVVADQMAQLKAGLEEQGLKVDKLEVQTELPRDASTSDNWQGQEQHNLAREQEARQRIRSRLRTLRSEARGMVQEMQNSSPAAKISHDGLDIFA